MPPEIGLILKEFGPMIKLHLGHVFELLELRFCVRDKVEV